MVGYRTSSTTGNTGIYKVGVPMSMHTRLHLHSVQSFPSLQNVAPSLARVSRLVCKSPRKRLGVTASRGLHPRSHDEFHPCRPQWILARIGLRKLLLAKPMMRMSPRVMNKVKGGTWGPQGVCEIKQGDGQDGSSL